jgi:hypothetical protein
LFPNFTEIQFKFSNFKSIVFPSHPQIEFHQTVLHKIQQKNLLANGNSRRTMENLEKILKKPKKNDYWLRCKSLKNEIFHFSWFWGCRWKIHFHDTKSTRRGMCGRRKNVDFKLPDENFNLSGNLSSLSMRLPTLMVFMFTK